MAKATALKARQLADVGPWRVEVWPADRLVPYARNPRKNDHAVDRMVGSIREFGFKIPVLARSDGTIVDGHLRLKAAQKLGIGDVPVLLCDEWTEAQVRAFRLMVNRSVGWAEWDDALISIEMKDLETGGFDLELTGFDGSEIADFTLGEDVEFKEFDESAADDVKLMTCPKCGHTFPA